MKVLVVAIALLVCGPALFANGKKPDGCARPTPGSVVQEPEDLSSHHGVLQVELTYRDLTGVNDDAEYCYQSQDGAESPTLRLKPGDLLILKLKNELKALAGTGAIAQGPPMSAGMHVHQPCDSSIMTALSTNLHFHGLTLPPTCHEDDVLRTLVQPGAPPFEYRFRIPKNEPAGLYWYHPHVHGFTNPQVLGGASGALIIEGIARANRLLAGLPERVFVIRDLDLLHPNAAPVQSGNAPPPAVLRDNDGQILNTRQDGGTPAEDLSINFVPVPFPNYPPAQILIRPNQHELWRVLNASAITYVDLQITVANAMQPLGVVALDGVPINENSPAENRILWVSHVFLPPAARAEFIFNGLPDNARAILTTRHVDTGAAGENDPTRPLATIVAGDSAPEPHLRLSPSPKPLPLPGEVWLGNVKPVRTRTFYFSEKPSDPKDPNSPTVFMITLQGQKPEPYDPTSTMPNIIVHQGDVEDWIIQNRTQELHAFHIHQLHFLLLDMEGVPIGEPFLRDTINVPYWDGRSTVYPSVKLRMDFRDPNVIGTFVYHCHLLEHEDAGMMGTIQVLPRNDRDVGSTTDKDRHRTYGLVQGVKQ